MFRSHTEIFRTPVHGNNSETFRKSNKTAFEGYKCDLCDMYLLTETDVDIHRKKVHIDELIPLIRSGTQKFCLICVRAQKSETDLVTHIKTEHLLSSSTAQRVEREIFICSLCENIYFNKKVLIAHIKFSHKSNNESAGKIPCPKCSKNVSNRHMWLHLTLHELNLNSTCQICLSTFKCKKDMKVHLNTHLSYFFCNICNLSIKKKESFDRHIEGHKRRRQQEMNSDVRRYFIPYTPLPPWKYKTFTGIKGLQLYNNSVCILCREICTGIAEKKRHILIDHAPDPEVKQKPMCFCGEEFFNMVLLKHHVFKMKGEHRLLGENETPSNSSVTLSGNTLSMDLGENETPSISSVTLSMDLELPAEEETEAVNEVC